MDWGELVKALKGLAATWEVPSDKPRLFAAAEPAMVGQLTSFVQEQAFAEWAACRLLIKYPLRFSLSQNGQMCSAPDAMFLLDEKIEYGQDCGQYAEQAQFPASAEVRLSIAETLFPFPFIDWESGKVWVKLNRLHISSADPEQIYWPKVVEFENSSIFLDLRPGERLDELLDETLTKRIFSNLAERSEKDEKAIQVIISLASEPSEEGLDSTALKKEVEARIGSSILWKNWSGLRAAARDEAARNGIFILQNGRPKGR